MNPSVIRYKDLELRILGESAHLKIILDEENGARNLAMGIVTFEPQGRTPKHTRAVEEVILVLRGEALVVTEMDEYRLGPGDTILIPAGIEHYHENPSAEDVLEQIYIFAPQGPEKSLRGLPIR